MTRWMHAKETKNRTYMQWSAEPAETSMERKDQQQATRLWTTRRDEKKRRMGLVSSWMSGPLLPREKLVDSLEALIAPTFRLSATSPVNGFNNLPQNLRYSGGQMVT